MAKLLRLEFAGALHHVISLQQRTSKENRCHAGDRFFMALLLKYKNESAREW